MKSFKQMIASKEVKRADSMRIRLADIHEQPGFNRRTEGAELAASITSARDFLLAGGQLPPVEVRPRDEGGVWLVEGHRRTRAYRMADHAGGLAKMRDENGDVWVPIVSFEGDEAQRKARIITSNNQVPLSPLETAAVYADMVALGHDVPSIAAMAHKTPQHVQQLLHLAKAPEPVRQAVQDGTVSAAVAVKIARTHGDKAGKVLKDEVAKAKAQGKSKVTDGTMKPKALPLALAKRLEHTGWELLAGVSEENHATLESVRSGSADKETTITVSAWDLLQLLDAHEAVKALQEKQASKARAKVAKARQRDLEAA